MEGKLSGLFLRIVITQSHMWPTGRYDDIGHLANLHWAFSGYD